jgi:hypothetical protein
MGRMCSMCGRNTNFMHCLSHERERLLGSPRCRWEDNSKMVCKEVVSEDVGVIHLSQAPSGVLF